MSLIKEGDIDRLEPKSSIDSTDKILIVDDIAGGLRTITPNIITPPNASETVAGIAELATTSEATIGTDDTKIMTPLKVRQAIGQFEVDTFQEVYEASPNKPQITTNGTIGSIEIQSGTGDNTDLILELKDNSGSTNFAVDGNGDVTANNIFAMNQNVRTTDNVTFNNISTTGTVDGRDVSVDGAKLDGIASGATSNNTDSFLLNRTNHTGTQTLSTISDSGSLAGLNTVGTSQIDNDSITLDKIASGTAGNLISYDSSGNPSSVVTGTSSQVLTSNGAGNAPTFQDAPSGNLEYIGTVNPSGSTLSITGLSDFTNDDILMIKMDQISWNGSGNFFLRFNGSSLAQNGGYVRVQSTSVSGSSAAGGSAISILASTTGANGAIGTYFISGLASGGSLPNIQGQGSSIGSTGYPFQSVSAGQAISSAITSIVFTAPATITSGKAILFRMRAS